MKISCQENMVPGKSFKEKIKKLEEWGYDGVEVWGDFLWDRVDEIKAAVKGSSVKVGSVCNGVRGSLLAAEKDQRKLAVEDIKRILPAGAELGAVGLIVVPVFGGPKVPDLSPWKTPWEMERELLLELLFEVAPVAEETKCAVLLEPLNRYETHFMNRLEQAVDICKKVNSPYIRLMADFFHMAIEEADIPQALKKASKYNWHIHLADSNRILPGMGHTNFKTAFRTLKNSGFDKFMALECGVPGDADQVLPETARYLKGIIEGV